MGGDGHPDQSSQIDARFSSTTVNNVRNFQADYLGPERPCSPVRPRLPRAACSPARRLLPWWTAIRSSTNIDRFDLLIDWGWFYFITKPLFLVIDWIYHVVGNFGVAILIVTVLLKGIFFPLANKSYASMAKMKALQPEMMAIRERYKDDRTKQQQATMELYKKEKVNPVAGCLPILVQIPVFFALYKVLFVTIEMRHAPFFGWIHDLSAPDPTTIFNLFGLIPWNPGSVPVIGAYLMLGAWPLIMGVTMWVQMKLNPAPPDPTQQVIFNWMPVHLHLHARAFCGRTGDLLGLEQHAVRAPAGRHHAPARREDRIVGQYPGQLSQEGKGGQIARSPDRLSKRRPPRTSAEAFFFGASVVPRASLAHERARHGRVEGNAHHQIEGEGQREGGTQA